MSSERLGSDSALWPKSTVFAEMETYENGHLMYDKFTNLKDPF